MVSGTLALLKYLVIYMNGKQGSGPNRGRSPVEWGEIPSIRPPRYLSQAQGGPSQVLGGPSQAVGGQCQALIGLC